MAAGEVVEAHSARSELAGRIARRLMNHSGAALVVDYGHVRSGSGETLQALRNHKAVSVLDRPGESDLTAHVDFEILGRALKRNGARVWAPLSQRQFLLGMGLELRAQALKDRMRSATVDVDEAVARLTEPAQMGDLFKVMAATSPDLSRPYPFVCELR